MLARNPLKFSNMWVTASNLQTCTLNKVFLPVKADVEHVVCWHQSIGRAGLVGCRAARRRVFLFRGAWRCDERNQQQQQAAVEAAAGGTPSKISSPAHNKKRAHT